VNRLVGKVAFVAGATSGIGQAAAEMFASEGARVVVAGRRIPEGQAVVDGIRQRAGEAIFVQTDVTEAESVESAIRTTIEAYDRLDVLFNNAGGSTSRDGPVTSAPLDEFWRAVKLDLFGTWVCCRYGIPELIKGGGGSVINMASMAGISGSPGRDAYTSAKGGVVALTRSMAREFSSRRIRVNAIAPAAVRTERILKLLETVPAAGSLIAGQVLGLIDPQEIAYAAVYLAADESRTLTGQIIAIHGGLGD
jgi:NAD(P)-dependent dehydrogenase (short-subunit alcohol dehydrogenase family)